MAVLLASAQAMATPVTYVNIKEVTVGAGQHGRAGATCNSSSHKVVGGGWTSPNGKVFFDENYPLEDSSHRITKWRVGAKNMTNKSVKIRSYVVCLTHAASATSYLRRVNGVSVPNGSGRTATPECRANGYVSGGGFYSTTRDSRFLPVVSRPASNTRWETTYENATGGTKSFDAYAVCVEGLTGTFSTEPGPKAWVGAGYMGPEEEPAVCGTGTIALGGGYEYNLHIHNDPGVAFINRSYPIDVDRSWLTEVSNYSTNLDRIGSYIRCFKQR